MTKTAPAALLMIRTWEEDGSDPSFRAQIRVATDLSSGFASTINVTDHDRVVEIVRAFLDSSTPPRPDAARGDVPRG
jgi:hypothetical protein